MDAQGLWLGVSAAATLGGTIATYGFDRGSPLSWRIPAGFCIGLAALGLVGFALALRFGLTAGVVAAAAAAAGSPAAVLLSRRHRERIAKDVGEAIRDAVRGISRLAPRTVAKGAAWAAGLALLWRVASRVMLDGPEGIYTGIVHNFGDLPFHLTVTNRFLSGENFPPEHPSFAGVGFTYPFLVDFLGAMFVAAGLPARDVIVWSTLLLCLALAALLYRWTLALTGSAAAARLAPILALLSGGLGWWLFVAEAWHGDGSVWMLLGRLPHDYTITADHRFRWGNLVTTLLATQRGLLLGLPLAVIVFHLWWQATEAPDLDARARHARMLAAGIITGMLPLVHAHSYGVVTGMAACLAVLSRQRPIFLPFFSWSLALGLPQIWWLARTGGVRGAAFMAWAVGWDRGDQNVLGFWVMNTGLLIPLVATALLWRGREPLVPRALLLYYLPFTLCFIGPNLFRLAPWIWDNIKVLIYWFIASVPLVALVLARLARGGRWRAALAAALFVSLTLAGALDLWRVASGAFRWRVFDPAGIAFATRVAEATGPTALILHAPMANHPIALTGRRSLMGYPGHVWSHGLDPGPRERDIARIYAGGSDAAALLARYGIDYVVVGPSERARLGANERFFERYAQVAEAGGYRLHRIADATAE